ncbi:MFS transporter [Alkalilimnicola sp. S0819]|uniref:MFS transporter n=1 Tax=Alkalilimnicola sp. S0819 TaxID=2613922 RepID=UPI0012620B06|nr:MFS transporter [Alkalilimnicola sp. S0819]KAB7623708.1 MFS transporter [Alkalilimnicola sp. S0819]MPQ16837.1 MFS transporter [Alkalilimnicola sp. S0819]
MLKALAPDQRRNYLFLLLTAGGYFCGLSFLLLLPKYLRDLGATEQELGWLVGIPLIPFLILAPLVGRLADRVPPRRLATLGLVITLISQLGFMAVEQVGVLAYALRLLGGVGHALVFTTVFTLVARCLSAEYKAQGVAYFTVVVQSGNILGSFVGALVLTRFGGAAFFLLSAVLIGGAVVLLHQVRPAAQEAPVSAGAGLADGVAMEQSVLGVLALILVLGGAFGMVLQFVPTYFDALFESGAVTLPINSAWFLTATLLTVALARLLLGSRIYQPGREPLLLLCMIGLPGAILLLQGISGPVSAVSVAILFGLSYGLLFPAANAMVLLRMGSARQGQASGTLAMLYEVGFRGFGFLMGPLAQYYGYQIMFQVLAALVLAGAAGFLLLEQDRRRWVFGSA